MTDTVFILGAGFSYDAGIPLLSGFVDRMLDFAIKGKNSDQLLSPADIGIFKYARKFAMNLMAITDALILMIEILRTCYQY